MFVLVNCTPCTSGNYCGMMNDGNLESKATGSGTHIINAVCTISCVIFFIIEIEPLFLPQTRCGSPATSLSKVGKFIKEPFYYIHVITYVIRDIDFKKSRIPKSNPIMLIMHFQWLEKSPNFNECKNCNSFFGNNYLSLSLSLSLSLTQTHIHTQFINV